MHYEGKRSSFVKITPTWNVLPTFSGNFPPAKISTFTVPAVIYDAFQDMEEKHSLHHQLQDKLENYWGQFDHALRNYKETNAERRAAFEELKAKDDESAKEIDTQMRKLQRISVIVF